MVFNYRILIFSPSRKPRTMAVACVVFGGFYDILKHLQKVIPTPDILEFLVKDFWRSIIHLPDASVNLLIIFLIYLLNSKLG